MTGALIVAIPSKGRLQENTAAFFERAGLIVERSGGERNYRGRFKGVDGIEIAFLSASEISGELAAGNVHFGVTGLDLIHEKMPDEADRDAHVHVVHPLGFGHADVVLAIPDQWLDVETMSDLVDVAVTMRTTRKARMRIATKYVNLATAFLAGHGLTDYRLVESLGATEGAPAAGAAEAIIDITSTGSTLRANHLRVLPDGVILQSQAHLIAARTIAWSRDNLAMAKRILAQVAAQKAAQSLTSLTVAGPLPPHLLETLRSEQGCRLQHVADGSGLVTMLCPKESLYAVVTALQASGAQDVAVSAPDYVFSPDIPAFDSLATALTPAG